MNLLIITIVGLVSISKTSCASALPKSCSDIQVTSGQHASGIYTIYPNGRKGVQAYCDLDTLGGGWTVIQRRGSQLQGNQQREDFYRSWDDYERGFGSPTNDHWLGLQNIHSISTSANHELRIEMTTWYGEKEDATYKIFNISNSEDLYKLHISDFVDGNAGDSLGRHNGRNFSTYDKDNDVYAGSCSVQYKGAWWYYSCHLSNLNGEYLNSVKTEYANGIQWYTWTGYYKSLKTVEMKIRTRIYNWCN